MKIQQNPYHNSRQSDNIYSTRIAEQDLKITSCVFFKVYEPMENINWRLSLP